MNKITNERTNIKKKGKQQQPPLTAYEVQTKRLQWIAFNWQTRNQTIWTFYWVSANLRIRIDAERREFRFIWWNLLSTWKLSLEFFLKEKTWSSFHTYFYLLFDCTFYNRKNIGSSWLYLSRVSLWFAHDTFEEEQKMLYSKAIHTNTLTRKQSNMEMSANAMEFAKFGFSNKFAACTVYSTEHTLYITCMLACIYHLASFVTSSQLIFNFKRKKFTLHLISSSSSKAQCFFVGKDWFKGKSKCITNYDLSQLFDSEVWCFDFDLFGLHSHIRSPITITKWFSIYLECQFSNLLTLSSHPKWFSSL